MKSSKSDTSVYPASEHTRHIRELDHSYFVHPWENVSATPASARTVAASANGIYITDTDGNELLDGPGGMWCTQIGYGRKEMADAIAQQVIKMPYFSPFNLTSEPPALLSQKLAQLAPGDLNHVFFTTGGSTAVDTALRFVSFRNNCLGKPHKKRIISRHDAYHGSTYLSASASGKTRDKNLQDQATHIVDFISSPNPLNRKKGQSLEQFKVACAQELEDKILELGPNNVGGFIAEPVLASGGVVIPVPGYHKLCLDICKKYDVLYISDEVVTGFGRLGHWFASKEVFEIQPDIITIAKGLTSGYLPLGACLVSDALMHSMKENNPEGVVFSNGFTYSGHPVCCAAALKNIEIIEREEILEHVRNISPYFQAKMKALETCAIVKEVRGEGLMACVECEPNREKSSLEQDYQLGARIDMHCQQLGLLVRPIINMCVISPPLIITREQIDDLIDKLHEGIVRTMKEMPKDF